MQTKANVLYVREKLWNQTKGHFEKHQKEYYKNSIF